MGDLKIPEFTIDWQSLYSTLQTTGVEVGKNLIAALLIFFVGRIIARALIRGLRKLMQAQQVDKILETFICNLAYW
ncbi:MAG: hypothetical protein WBN32_09120, partial [Woeseia sp.]